MGENNNNNHNTNTSSSSSSSSSSLPSLLIKTYTLSAGAIKLDHCDQKKTFLKLEQRLQTWHSVQSRCNWL
jgi:hypothetical protein